MSERIAYGIAMLVGLCAVIGTPVQAAKTVVALTSQHLTVHEEQGDLGDYYTLTLPVPNLNGQELLGAYLEFYVDVDAIEIEDVTNDAPVLEIFALTQTHGGSVDAEEFGTSAAPPGLVMVGEGRRVVRDITGIVQGYLDNPDSNYGLILGSLTGERDGLFTVKTGVLDQGVVARLIVHHRDE